MSESNLTSSHESWKVLLISIFEEFPVLFKNFGQFTLKQNITNKKMDSKDILLSHHLRVLLERFFLTYTQKVISQHKLNIYTTSLSREFVHLQGFKKIQVSQHQLDQMNLKKRKILKLMSRNKHLKELNCSNDPSQIITSLAARRVKSLSTIISNQSKRFYPSAFCGLKGLEIIISGHSTYWQRNLNTILRVLKKSLRSLKSFRFLAHSFLRLPDVTSKLRFIKYMKNLELYEWICQDLQSKQLTKEPVNHLGRIIPRSHMLRYLDIHNSFIFGNLAYKLLPNFRSLHTFKIDLSGKVLKKDDSNLVLTFLKSLDRLVNLELNGIEKFDAIPKLSIKTLKSLKYGIQGHQAYYYFKQLLENTMYWATQADSLETLSLSSFFTCNINQEIVDSYLADLKKLKIKHYYLVSDFLYFFTPEQLEEFYQILSSFPLETLKISIIDNFWEHIPMSFYAIAKKIHGISTLESFTFIQKAPKEISEGLQSLSSSFEYLNNLKKLKLKFMIDHTGVPPSIVTDDVFFSFSQGLKQCNKLEELTLKLNSISYFPKAKEQVSFLYDLIGEVSNLRRLRLSISHKSLTSCRSIRKLKKLERMSLYWPNCQDSCEKGCSHTFTLIIQSIISCKNMSSFVLQGALYPYQDDVNINFEGKPHIMNELKKSFRGLNFLRKIRDE